MKIIEIKFGGKELNEIKNKISDEITKVKDSLFKNGELKIWLGIEDVEKLNEDLLSMSSKIQGILSKHCKSVV